jgi:hypothetical protein
LHLCFLRFLNARVTKKNKICNCEQETWRFEASGPHEAVARGMVHVYVVELNLTRKIVAVVPCETDAEAQEYIRNAMTQLLPEYAMHPHEVRAGVSRLEAVCEDDDDVDDENDSSELDFARHTGFSFDGGKYVAFVSAVSGYDLTHQTLRQLKARPVYSYRSHRLQHRSSVVVVLFNYMYGQGVGSGIGVYATPEIAVCDLWRNTFGSMDGPGAIEDTGGFQLDIFHVFSLRVGDDPTETLALEPADFDPVISVWDVASESDEWTEFRFKTIRRLQKCMTKHVGQVDAPVSPSTCICIHVDRCGDTWSAQGRVMTEDIATLPPYAQDEDTGNETYCVRVNTTITCVDDARLDFDCSGVKE